MSGELAVARANPAVVAGLIVAEVAVTLCALVAIAYMLGWIPSRSAAPAPASSAGPAQTAPAHDVALAPGETLIAAPEKPLATSPAAPGPVIPKYSKQPERLPSPMAAASPAPAPGRPAPAARPEPSVTRAAPATPAYARAAPPAVTSYERSARSICINCGTVSSVRSAQGEWEVRVRFEDGSNETLRYPDRPRFRAGDRVRLEDGGLVAD